MIELTVLLASAALGFGAARWTGLPPIPVLILAGVAGSAAFPLDDQFLGDALTLGVIGLVFVAGIELNPARLWGRGNAAIRVGLVQFVVLGALGMLASLLLGLEAGASAYVALALAASSTLVVVKILQDRGLMYEPVGRLVTGVLLFQDLLIILCIPVVARLEEGWGAAAAGVGATLGLMAVTGAICRWGAPALLRRFTFEEEIVLLLGLSTLFGFMGAALLLGLPPVSGAFLAGVSLSGFPTSAVVRGQVSSLGDFFHPLFFAALGAILPLPSAVELGRAMVLGILVVGVTPPLVAVLAERVGFSARPALASGLLLSQTSEFSLVVALQGLLLGQLDEGVFVVVTLVTVGTMITTPFLTSDRTTWALVRMHPFRRSPRLPRTPEGHVLLLGCGQHGEHLLEELIVTRSEIVVVDDDPALVDRVRKAGVTALRGDISDVRLLEKVGADRARVVLSTVPRREDNVPLLRFARGVPILVRGFNLEDGEWIAARGGRPILYSEAAAEDFRDWFENEWVPAQEP